MNHSAFPLKPVPIPLTVNISEESSDISDLERVLRSREWDTIADSELRELAYTFSLLTDEATRYYLPALIGSRIPEVIESAVQITCPTIGNGREIDCGALFRLFGPYTSDQRTSVLQFLQQYRAGYQEIDQAINSFWSKPYSVFKS